jgi:imidazolonepropionase-like amidohydrolase
VIIENIRIFDGKGDKLSAPSHVLVVGNVIKAISSAPIAVPPGTAVTRIQGGGRTLMPGMSDLLAHIFMSASSQAEPGPVNTTFARGCSKCRRKRDSSPSLRAAGATSGGMARALDMMI